MQLAEPLCGPPAESGLLKIAAEAGAVRYLIEVAGDLDRSNVELQSSLAAAVESIGAKLAQLLAAAESRPAVGGAPAGQGSVGAQAGRPGGS